jgi:hypothetical protein
MWLVMSWPINQSGLPRILDVRIVDSFKSFCRKCACHHPLDSEIHGFLKGCICNPAARRGVCGRYVPQDNLEFLEYLVRLEEESK